MLTKNKKKGIATEYKGIWFRSRLEAKWARVFDAAGYKWEYEPLDLHYYQPDFRVVIGRDTYIVEVKPLTGDDWWVEGAADLVRTRKEHNYRMVVVADPDNVIVLENDGETWFKIKLNSLKKYWSSAVNGTQWKPQSSTTNTKSKPVQINHNQSLQSNLRPTVLPHRPELCDHPYLYPRCGCKPVDYVYNWKPANEPLTDKAALEALTVFCQTVWNDESTPNCDLIWYKNLASLVVTGTTIKYRGDFDATMDVLRRILFVNTSGDSSIFSAQHVDLLRRRANILRQLMLRCGTVVIIPSSDYDNVLQTINVLDDNRQSPHQINNKYLTGLSVTWDYANSMIGRVHTRMKQLTDNWCKPCVWNGGVWGGCS